MYYHDKQEKTNLLQKRTLELDLDQIETNKVDDEGQEENKLQNLANTWKSNGRIKNEGDIDDFTHEEHLEYLSKEDIEVINKSFSSTQKSLDLLQLLDLLK